MPMEEARVKYENAMRNFDEIMALADRGHTYIANEQEMAKGADAVDELVEQCTRHEKD